MTKEEKEKLEDDLNQLYTQASSNSVKLTTTFDLLANIDDLGSDEIENLEVHDYEKDLAEAREQGSETVDHLANLYLDNNQDLVNHPYIIKKRQSDAGNTADMIFLQKIAKRALIMQLKQMDMGDTTPRHYETFFAGMREVRENIKQSSAAQNQMEGFYKKLREDLGIADRPLEVASSAEVEEEETGTMLDPHAMNSRLEAMILKAKAEKDKNQE